MNNLFLVLEKARRFFILKFIITIVNSPIRDMNLPRQYVDRAFTSATFSRASQFTGWPRYVGNVTQRREHKTVLPYHVTQPVLTCSGCLRHALFFPPSSFPDCVRTAARIEIASGRTHHIRCRRSNISPAGVSHVRHG
jgi:hypothetical protein